VLSVEAADRIGVFGQTGTGKTEYVKRELLTPLLASNVRVLALDVKDELSIRGRPRGNTAVGPLPYRWTASQVAYQPEVLADPALRPARCCG
jgi:DNA helicase HerA-like ATPase